MLKLGLATTGGWADAGGAHPGALRSSARAGGFGAQDGQAHLGPGCAPATLDTLGLIATVNWYAADFFAHDRHRHRPGCRNVLTLSVVRNIAVFRIVRRR